MQTSAPAVSFQRLKFTGGQTLFNSGSQPPYSPGYATGTTNPGLKKDL